jgi:phage gp36-like protein
MSWRTITEADVKGAMSEPELSAYNAAAIGVAQDPLADITETAVQEARAHIADCATNSLAAGSTVPIRVVHHLLAIIRFRMLTRVDASVSEDRRAEYRAAMRFFERVSECKVGIEAPEGATEATGSTARTETLSSRTPIATRDKLSGL